MYAESTIYRTLKNAKDTELRRYLTNGFNEETADDGFLRDIDNRE